MDERRSCGVSKRTPGRAVLKLVQMIFADGKWILSAELAIAAVCSALPVLTSYFWQQILQRTKERPSELLIFFLLLACSGGLMLANGYFREVFDTMFRHCVSKNMQKRVHQKAGCLPMDDYEDATLNDLLTCAGEKFFYGDVLGFLMQGIYALQLVVSMVLTGCLVWSYHPILELPFAAMLAVQVLGLRTNHKKAELDLALVPLRRKQQVYQAYLTKYENVKEVRTLGVHGLFCQKWQAAMREAMRCEEKTTAKINALRLTEELLKTAAVITAYLLCVFLADQRMVGIGPFGALILLMQQFQASSSEFVRRVEELHASAVQVQNGLAYLELPEEQRDQSLMQPLETITLEHVAYRYPEAKRSAVEDLCLQLKKNEIVAVVGKNGSGKTTFSSLLCGLLVPTQGTVRFNEVSAKELTNEALFGRTSAVLQKFSRYALTVRENILLGDIKKQSVDAELKELAAQMKVSFLSAGIDAAKGAVTLDTNLGVELGGMELSGGLWQQLAVLRACYKEAELVVLDEPTAALDPLKEAELFSAFETLCKGNIGVIITHRLGMCALADRIVHMDAGRIVEMGSHQELMERGGRYAQVFRQQAGMYDAEV